MALPGSWFSTAQMSPTHCSQIIHTTTHRTTKQQQNVPLLPHPTPPSLLHPTPFSLHPTPISLHHPTPPSLHPTPISLHHPPPPSLHPTPPHHTSGQV